MLAKRIIPCLDVKDGRVVKGVRFLDLRDAGDPVEQAAVYDAERADELVFLDITASHERRDIMLDVVRRVAETVFIPFTVGGGLRAVEDIREILVAGADKICTELAEHSMPGAGQKGWKAFLSATTGGSPKMRMFSMCSQSYSPSSPGPSSEPTPTPQWYQPAPGIGSRS